MPCSASLTSCGTCLSSGGSSCGWCHSSLSCEEGNKFGPATPSSCGNWAWYYQYCPGDPEDKCPKLQTCAECVVNGRADPFEDPTSCGWCEAESGAQRCVSGQIGGPAIGARCVNWFFSQFTNPDQCPAAPPSSSKSQSLSPSPTLTASAQVTFSLSGTSSGSGGGGGGGNALSPITVDAVAVATTLTLLFFCAIGVAIGYWLRSRSLRASGVKDAVTLNSAYSAYSSAYSSK
jgi:hypothetical protein